MSFLISESDFRHLFRAIFQLDLWIKFDSHILILLFCFSQAGVAKRLIPLLDRILIQRAEALTKSKGGIVIPEKAQSKVLEGTVIAVGPGARNVVSKLTLSTLPKPSLSALHQTHPESIKLTQFSSPFQNGEHIPLSVQVGDKVLLPEYGGTKVELDADKTYHLFRESDILAKVE